TQCERVIGTMSAFHAYIPLPYFSTIKENAKSCQLKLGVLTLPRRDNKYIFEVSTCSLRKVIL
ncbi:MAG: hypothetical protein R8M38_08555, partial [Mariprofundaceae bacterium]